MADKPRIPEDQEIDLSAVTGKLKGTFQAAGKRTRSFGNLLYRFRFVILVLVIAGIAAGTLIDSRNRLYTQEIIVIPNFGSVDYLYSKIDLVNAKIRENDTIFLKKIGIKHPSNLHLLKIEPINNVYQFVADNEVHFELLKLIAEDENMEDVMEDRVTSKNYSFHLLKYTTTGKTSYQETITPLLNYFNNSEYYNQVKAQVQQNEKLRMQSNELLMKQIDNILNAFNQNSAGSGAKSSQLVYYNENTQLNEIIKTREWLVQEQGKLNLNMINFTKVIKDSSVTMNMIATDGVAGKMKLMLPLLLVTLFVAGLLLFAPKKYTAR